MRSLELLLLQQGSASTSGARAHSGTSTSASATVPRVDPLRTRIEDAFEGLEQLMRQLDSVQIDGSVLKKTGVVQTLTRLKRDEKFLRCRDAASALVKKWYDHINISV